MEKSISDKEKEFDRATKKIKKFLDKDSSTTKTADKKMILILLRKNAVILQSQTRKKGVEVELKEIKNHQQRAKIIIKKQ